MHVTDGSSISKDRWIFLIVALVGLGGILYGYDIGVVSGALLFIHKSIPMNATQTGIIVGAVLAGGLVGTLIAGPLADWYGRRFMIGAASLIFMLGVSCVLLSHSFYTMLLARLLLGVGVGVVSVAVPLYVAELVPTKDRGKYVTFFQLFLTFGIVLAYFIDLLFTHSGNWRGMFAVVLIPAVILFVSVFFLPETPRWLLSKGHQDTAISVLLKTHPAAQIESEVAEIKESLGHVDGGWKELFQRHLWLPLCIAIGVAVLNQWTGINSFLQYAPDLLKRAGLGSNMVVMLGSAGVGMINFICTIVAMLLVDKIGRRPLLITGVAGVVISEIFLGVVSMSNFAPGTEGVLSLIGLFGFILSFAIGPGVVVWLAMSELFPTPVRGKGLALCLFFSSLSGALMASMFLNLTNVLGVAGTYWLCAGFSTIYLLLAIFLLPETKDKSLESIQEYFEHKTDEVKNAS